VHITSTFAGARKLKPITVRSSLRTMTVRFPPYWRQARNGGMVRKGERIHGPPPCLIMQASILLMFQNAIPVIWFAPHTEPPSETRTTPSVGSSGSPKGLSVAYGRPLSILFRGIRSRRSLFNLQFLDASREDFNALVTSALPSRIGSACVTLGASCFCTKYLLILTKLGA
jgi:hypothetical protein